MNYELTKQTQTNPISSMGTKAGQLLWYNIEMREKIELLAPAKDLQAGLAAVKRGADAGYIGGEHFSSREAACNSIAA